MKDVVPQSINIHGYADDHAVKKRFRPIASEELGTVEEIIECCLAKIKIWMDSNRLKMNDAKTEFIYFGSPKQLQKCLTVNITVNITL